MYAILLTLLPFMPDGGSTIGFIPSVTVIVLIPIATTSRAYIQWLDQIVAVKDTMVRGWVDFFQRPMAMNI